MTPTSCAVCFSGECGNLVSNSNYFARAIRTTWTAALILIKSRGFSPNQERNGAHMENLFRLPCCKPMRQTRDNAVKFLDVPVLEHAQPTSLCRATTNYPPFLGVKTGEVVAIVGEFKADEVNLSGSGKNIRLHRKS